MSRRIVLNKGFKIAWLLLLIMLLICIGTSCQEVSTTETIDSGSPAVEPLTPAQVVEYIDIFHMQCDKTNEQILAGEDYTLKATPETADLLFRLNFFTDGLHGEPAKSTYPFGTIYPLNVVSKEFFDAYKNAQNAKEKYTGHLTAHWIFDYPFLRVELVEAYPAEVYWFYKNIPEEILRRAYIEIDGIPLTQYLDLMERYCLGWDLGSWLEYDGTGSIIRREKLNLGDEEWNFIKHRRKSTTEEHLSNLNGLYLENPEYYKEKALMQEYGLSIENPMTFEWVVAHPKEAYALCTITLKPYTAFQVRNRTFDDEFFEKRGIPILPPKDDLK